MVLARPVSKCGARVVTLGGSVTIAVDLISSMCLTGFKPIARACLDSSWPCI